MLAVVAIVGRPNVGKSTLFNVLSKSRAALVADLPGVTRDRQYGECRLGERPFIVIDTGGVQSEKDGIDSLVEAQSWRAVKEADLLLWIVDARSGITSSDQVLAQQLRATGKPLLLVVNKIDGLDSQVALAEFYALGMGKPYGISAAHGRGVNSLLEHINAILPADKIASTDASAAGIKMAIIGRPNVGKSTLVNRLLGEKRVLVFDQPGTTRDSIYLPMQHEGMEYTIIDTAGIRKRAKIEDSVEKFSVVKTLQAIEDAHVVIFLIDAKHGITDQDMSLLGFVLEAGRSLVIAMNKWDGLSVLAREALLKSFEYRLMFANFAKLHTISALHGTGVGHLFASVNAAYDAATRKLSTGKLTRILEKAVALHPPPIIQKRRIKLRYAHTGGHLPPIIVIHGNQTESVPDSYTRYLMNTFRKELKLEGTPVRIQYKSSQNPYADRRKPAVNSKRGRAKAIPKGRSAFQREPSKRKR